MNFGRWLCAVPCAALAAAGSAAPAQELRLLARVDLAAAAVESEPSWLAGGFGRLPDRSAGNGSTTAGGTAAARAGVEWEPSLHLRLLAHLAGRRESAALGGRAAGLVEAFADGTLFPRGGDRLRLRAGLFFPPTSRENVAPLWTSPYTLTLSALNTWLAEEMRLRGADLEYALALAPEGEGEGAELRLAGGAFDGNDAAGALLAWRGWTLGERPAVLGETLPLPPLPQLATAFADQRDDGTAPVGERDLDGRWGWTARARLGGGGARRALLQGWSLDNRGDRALHRGEYAWRTRLRGLGGELGIPLAGGGPASREGRELRLIAEWATGDSGMGRPPGAAVDVDVRAGYLLAAWRGERLRAALRHDRFASDDRDRRPGEPDGERGTAWTAAAFVALRAGLELAIELVEVDADRPGAALAGGPRALDARRLALALRWSRAPP
jgi:hypothetical protein